MLLVLCKSYQIVTNFVSNQRSSHMSCPFAGAPVYGMLLSHAERLRVVGCGFKGKLVRLLSHAECGRHFEPQSNNDVRHKLMRCIVRRVAAGLAAAVRHKVAKEAEELCASGLCAAAVVPLQQAIDFGDFTSRALLAWMLVHGRKGVAQDVRRAFDLAEEGVRLGCHHCKGVMAYCLYDGHGCEIDWEQSLDLARQSSGRRSKYGQYMLGMLHQVGGRGLVVDIAQALAFYRLAAVQGLDVAQNWMGTMYYGGYGVARDLAEALRWYQLAAAQGYPEALFEVAEFHLYGYSVAADVVEAIRWYRRAQAAGHPLAKRTLEMLCA